MKLRVNFGTNNEIEVESENNVELAKIVNETIKKFFPGTNWVSYDVDYS